MKSSILHFLLASVTLAAPSDFEPHNTDAVDRALLKPKKPTLRLEGILDASASAYKTNELKPSTQKLLRSNKNLPVKPSRERKLEGLENLDWSNNDMKITSTTLASLKTTRQGGSSGVTYVSTSVVIGTSCGTDKIAYTLECLNGGQILVATTHTVINGVDDVSCVSDGPSKQTCRHTSTANPTAEAAFLSQVRSIFTCVGTRTDQLIGRVSVPPQTVSCTAPEGGVVAAEASYFDVVAEEIVDDFVCVDGAPFVSPDASITTCRKFFTCSGGSCQTELVWSQQSTPIPPQAIESDSPAPPPPPTASPPPPPTSSPPPPPSGPTGGSSPTAAPVCSAELDAVNNCLGALDTASDCIACVQAVDEKEAASTCSAIQSEICANLNGCMPFCGSCHDEVVELSDCRINAALASSSCSAISCMDSGDYIVWTDVAGSAYVSDNEISVSPSGDGVEFSRVSTTATTGANAEIMLWLGLPSSLLITAYEICYQNTSSGFITATRLKQRGFVDVTALTTRFSTTDDLRSTTATCFTASTNPLVTTSTPILLELAGSWPNVNSKVKLISVGVYVRPF